MTINGTYIHAASCKDGNFVPDEDKPNKRQKAVYKMRKAMAIVRLSQTIPTYRIQYLKIVTREFVDIDFTTLISNREYHDLSKLCHDVIKLAKVNSYRIEVHGDRNKMPDILIDTGTGTLSKYILIEGED